LNALAQQFLDQAPSHGDAMSMALAQIQKPSAGARAYVMAYADCFYIMGIAMGMALLGRVLPAQALEAPPRPAAH